MHRRCTNPAQAAALCLIVAACTRPPASPSCAGLGGTPMLEYQLFFGRGIPGRSALTDQEWADFAADVVTPQLPDGFTEFDADGQWMNPATHRISPRSHQGPHRRRARHAGHRSRDNRGQGRLPRAVPPAIGRHRRAAGLRRILSPLGRQFVADGCLDLDGALHGRPRHHPVVVRVERRERRPAPDRANRANRQNSRNRWISAIEYRGTAHSRPPSRCSAIRVIPRAKLDALPPSRMDRRAR